MQLTVAGLLFEILKDNICKAKQQVTNQRLSILLADSVGGKHVKPS